MLRKNKSSLNKIIELNDKNRELEPVSTYKLFDIYRKLSNSLQANFQEEKMSENLKLKYKTINKIILSGGLTYFLFVGLGTYVMELNKERNTQIKNFNAAYSQSYKELEKVSIYHDLKIGEYVVLSKNKDSDIKEYYNEKFKLSKEQLSDYIQIENYRKNSVIGIFFLIFTTAMMVSIIICFIKTENSINDIKGKLLKYRGIKNENENEMKFISLFKEMTKEYNIDKNVQIYDLILKEIYKIKEFKNNSEVLLLTKKYLDSCSSLKVSFFDEKGLYNLNMDLEKVIKDLSDFESYKESLIRLIKS